MNKPLITATVLISIAIPSIPQIIPGGATEWTQISNNFELVATVNQLVQEYEQLVKTYKQITNQYNQMVQNAKYVTGKNRWRSVLSQWSLPTGSNTYNSAGYWYQALNGGNGAVGGYRPAVTTLSNYANVWSRLSTRQQQNVATNYATVELSDAMSINSITEAGRIRGNATLNEIALNTLENDTLADGDDPNSEAALLNKIAAAGILNDRNGQDQNKLLVSILDHQTVGAKAQRDAMAQSINNDIAAHESGPALGTQTWANASNAYSTFRLR